MGACKGRACSPGAVQPQLALCCSSVGRCSSLGRCKDAVGHGLDCLKIVGLSDECVQVGVCCM